MSDIDIEIRNAIRSLQEDGITPTPNAVRDLLRGTKVGNLDLGDCPDDWIKAINEQMAKEATSQLLLGEKPLTSNLLTGQLVIIDRAKEERNNLNRVLTNMEGWSEEEPF